MENNPIIFSNKNTEALKEAQDTLLSILEQYSKSNDLSKEDIDTLKSIIRRQYNLKRIEYFMQEKALTYSNYIDKIINMSFNQDMNNVKDKNYSSVFYLKHTKELVSR